MEQLLEKMLEAYKLSYKSNGTHAPLTAHLRQGIIRFFKDGQKAVIDANRILSGRFEHDAGDAAEMAIGMVAFRHPKKKFPPGGLSVTEGKQGETTAKPEPVITEQSKQRHNRPAAGAIPQKQKSEVVAADEPEAEQSEPTDLSEPLNLSELEKLKEMKPAEILLLYSRGQVEATLATMKPRAEFENLTERQKAALLRDLAGKK